MALTPMRWVGAALAGCALLALTLLRAEPSERPSPPRRELERAMWDAQGEAAGAARLLRVTHLADSVRATLARGAGGDSGRVIIDPRLPRDMATSLARLVARAERHRPTQPRHRVDLVFVVDTITTLRGVNGAGFGSATTAYLLPRDDSESCVVLARIRSLVRTSAVTRAWIAAFSEPEHAQALLGPCGFYEWFGRPGPEISRWLSRGAWNFALVGGWQRNVGPWESNYWWGGGHGHGWPLRYYIGVDGYRCAAGDEAQCARQVLRESAVDPLRDEAVITDHMVSGSSFRRVFNQGPINGVLGPREPLLLASMARDIGPDRFREFWTSGMSPSAAFERATGEPIGRWTAGWSRRMYGESPRGPGLTVAGALLGVAVALVALALAFAKRQRRQVT